MGGRARILVVVSAVLVLAVVLGACGDDDDVIIDGATVTTAGADPSPSTTATAPAGDTDPSALDVELIDVDELVVGAATWSVRIANTGERDAVLTFPTAQRLEVELSSAGAVVHRWSDGRFFTQEQSSIRIPAAGETVVEVADELGGLDPGFYDVTVTVTSRRPPEPVTTNVRIEESDG